MSQEIWLGYAGTLGTSYDLSLVFDAIKRVNNPNLRFIVMGDGPLKGEFENIATGLPVFFTGRLPYEQICGVLTSCDIVVNPIIGSSVASIINKHADYAACGKPVLNTQKSMEYRKMIEQFQMGSNCDDVMAMADQIEKLIEDDKLRKKLGVNARECAEKRFDRKMAYNKLIKVITT